MIEQSQSSQALERERTRAAFERMLYSRFAESTKIKEAGDAWRDVILELVQTRLMPAIAEFPEESAIIMERLRGGEFSSGEVLAKAAIREFSDFMLPRFSSDELQERMRRFKFSEGRVQVGTMLEYDPVKEGVLTMHIQPTILTDPRTWLRLWRTDLQMLADRLRNDRSLQEVQQIQGDSRLVYDHPNIWENMGFRVVEVDDRKRRASIVLSRDEFLTRYPEEEAKQ